MKLKTQTAGIQSTIAELSVVIKTWNSAAKMCFNKLEEAKYDGGIIMTKTIFNQMNEATDDSCKTLCSAYDTLAEKITAFDPVIIVNTAKGAEPCYSIQ